MTAKVRKTGNVFAKRDASQVRSGLAGGGKWIRTLGSPREGLGFAPTLVIREVALPGIL
jgi:hypothetical protein